MTPRQIYFWLELNDKSNAEEALRDLQLIALGSQGTKKAIKEQTKALQKEAR